MRSALFAATRFIASSTLYYSCSANHSKQDMKSNHTDNAMEEQAPALPLTLSPAFLLETPGSGSAAPSNPSVLRILWQKQKRQGLGFSPLISKAPVLSGEWVYLCCY